MADKMLKIELKKSLIGRGAKQIATAEALGLKKPGDVTVQPSDSCLILQSYWQIMGSMAMVMPGTRRGPRP